MTEKEIIALIKSRDESGLEELLKHCGPLLRYIIAPILPSPEDREECLSEIVMRIWEKIDLYHPERGSWNGWITAIARNTAVNRARANVRFAVAAELSEELPSQEPTPEEILLMKEMHMEVKRALIHLQPAEQILFYRKYYYMQSTAQIASEMGMTERAVEGRLYRLKRKLRRLLGGEVYE